MLTFRLIRRHPILGRGELEIFSFMRPNMLPPAKLTFGMTFELICFHVDQIGIGL